MPHNGDDISTEYSTIKELIEDTKMRNDRRPYFYVIKMPSCGGERIKIGKSSNIYARFKYYQEHYYAETVKIKRLRRFHNILTDRFTDKGKKLYALFETEAIYYLRDLHDKKIKSGRGELSEWFDSKYETKVLSEFDKFVKEFETKKYDKTKRRKNLRSQGIAKGPHTLSDDPNSGSESSEEEEQKRPVRTKKPIKKYNPSKGK